jgi:hypothetical protein
MVRGSGKQDGKVYLRGTIQVARDSVNREWQERVGGRPMTGIEM